MISNEIYRPDGSRRAVPGAPLRPETARQLAVHGFRPGGGGPGRGVVERRHRAHGGPVVVTFLLVLTCAMAAGAGLVGLLRVVASGRVPAAPADPAAPAGTGEPVDASVGWRSGIGSVRRVVVAVLVGIIAFVVTGWVAVVPIAVMATLGLPVLYGRTSGSTSTERIEAIASWTEMLQSTLAASAGLNQAIVVTAPLAPLPIRPAALGLAGRLESGMSTRDALLAFADDLDDASADRVVCALVLAAASRAQRLGELLSALAESTRDEVALRLRIETSRASVRSGVRTVLIFSVSFAAGLALLARSYLAPFGSATGQIVLVAVGLLYAGGLWLMVTMSRPPAPVRLLGREVRS